MEIKEHICEIHSSSWMRSLERAFIGIKSPSGTVITIRKQKLDMLTDEQRKLICKLAGISGNHVLSTNEMQTVKEAYFAQNPKRK